MTHYSRPSWTSDPNGRTVPLVPAAVAGILLHWPAGNDYGRLNVDQVKDRLRGWKAFHERKGWADIGYNFAVDMAGNTYDLTGMTRGAHAGSQALNAKWVGVLLVVGENETPTAAMVEGVKSLRAHVLRLAPRAGDVKGHSHVRPEPTACPGDAVRHLIATGAFYAQGAAPQAPAPAPAPSGATLRKGSKGPRVGNLQRGLNRVFPAYSRLVVDDDFGNKTDGVVREFQRRVGLKDDGVVGPLTTAALARHGINL